MKKLILISIFLMSGMFSFSQAPKILKTENCDSVVTVALDSVKMLSDSIHAIKEREAKHQIISGILGDLKPWQYFEGYFFALIGIIFIWLVLARKGAKTNPTTPNEFKWSIFFNMENVITRVRSFFIAILTIFICFRFAPEIANSSFSPFFALGVGISLDYFTDLISNLKKKPTA